MLSRFQKCIAEHGLVSKDDKVLLAVSGGVDSMTMLALFAESGYDVAVAHCNFGLRGEESDGDEELVRKEAARRGVPFHSRRFDTTGEMERTGESVQIAARRLRYEWFSELCAEHGYTKVATAHHADDSIETFFINLLRGTGLRGLTGIGITNGRVIRPLLFATRQEIEEYARQGGLAFREDSSNSSTAYVRNKIRHELTPRLREMSTAFAETMERNMERLGEAQAFIGAAMERVRTETIEQRNEFIYIYPGRIDPSLPVRFVLYELLAPYGFRGEAVEALVAALHAAASGKRFYARDYVAHTDRGTIIVAPLASADSRELTMRRLKIEEVETLHVPSSIALLDADLLQFPLEIRRWREGDSFVPLGMTGRKKVSDYLIDTKVPLAEKERQLVVVSGGQIAWLVGRRIDNRCRITPKTENVLEISQ
ncbi:MAG: tRNA lysidine(34) synthetase TilS [Rikenellaceae bacterium]|nr:tRNA lysidine(34) synthetase TilS [Rikenellaceae bacterium]MCL2693224.1 tRNA lysidine(34) synthetase TilS [Rikenellaceae bacterium]